MLMPRCTRLEWLKLLVSIVIGSVRCGGSACIRYLLQKPCSAEQASHGQAVPGCNLPCSSQGQGSRTC